ncbi:MAG: Holliday junction branch migration protein RuvA [Bacteroidales bacterium]|jgi:Holliday junction DNA helicase RuvA|nr:Holliday junction branch migration protein RuvA [Bacteroidales bacterium]MCK9498832.1 Holliday junction branch migration protein RuvA [Bacteroidales bacterium]MDY0315088.1 Holliday junction branch migration protein RuvA [Bacteroidales bacterium]NLB85870.1 Holliday junction branch migration protein RuvA [Bacteroidales bacterium]
MFEYIKGLLSELTPAYAVVEANGIGYFINITVNTYSKLKKGQECKLVLHEILREDLHAIYGFENLEEREMFRKLITVNGVGANTARLILSSLSVNMLIQAISEENITVLKSVKGIGNKTAQRIIIELKDKLSDFDIQISQISSSLNNTLHKDALNALTMLGFSKPNVDKVLIKLLKDNNDIGLEELIKLALNYL